MNFSTQAAIFISTANLAFQALPSPPILAQSVPKFECGRYQGFPTTIVRSGSVEKPFIRWTSESFDNSGWPPERRCQAVSQRLQAASNDGSLKYLTTGQQNGIPVICGTDQNKGSCKHLIYTLKPGQNAAETLLRLVNARKGISGPISETTARPYISIESIINRE